MKKLLLVILCFTLMNSAKAGGPWLPLKGKGYVKLSEWWVVFDEHYTDAGLLDPNITTGVFNTSIYGEYGISDRVTGIVNAPIFSRNYMNNLVSITTNEVLIPGEALNSIGDVDLGFKYGITKRGANIPISATLILGLPTGKIGGGTQGNLQTGDGEFNQMIQIDAGTGFNLGKNISAYTSTYVGFNNRTNEFSEEFRFGLEGGLGFFERKLWIVSKLQVVESLKNGATAETINSTSLFANNTEFSTISVEANYYITPKVGVSASYTNPFRGEIIAAAPSYSVGVFLDLSK